MQKVKKYTEKIVTMENQVTMIKVIMGMAMMEMATMTRITTAIGKISYA